MEGQVVREYSCNVQYKVYSQHGLTEHWSIYRGDCPYACDMHSLVELV